MCDDMEGTAVHSPENTKGVTAHVRLGAIAKANLHKAQARTSCDKCLRPFIFAGGGKHCNTLRQLEGVFGIYNRSLEDGGSTQESTRYFDKFEV